MTTANTLIDEHPQIFDLDYLQQEVPIGWTEDDERELRLALDPYINWIEKYLRSGGEFRTHIEGSGSVAVPVGE